MSSAAATATNAQLLVDLKDVRLTYDGTRTVLDGASLRLEPGDFRFLTGASGAGKTTLLKLIYMAHRPSGGSVNVFGEDVGRLPADALPALRRRVGVVFQEFRLLDHLSVFENVALPMRVMGYKDTDYRGDVIDLLKWVDLASRIDAMPPMLSGGEKQRVALARALVAQPDLIIADEPTGNVDPEMSNKIMNLFLKLNEMGTAIILATHDIGMVSRVPKPVLTLKDGKVTLHPGATDGVMAAMKS